MCTDKFEKNALVSHPIQKIMNKNLKMIDRNMHRQCAWVEGTRELRSLQIKSFYFDYSSKFN